MFWKPTITIAVIDVLNSGVVTIFILLLFFSNRGKLQQTSPTSSSVLLVFSFFSSFEHQLSLASPYHRFAKQGLVQKLFNSWTHIEEKSAGWTIISRWVMGEDGASRSWAQPWEMAKGAFFIFAK